MPVTVIPNSDASRTARHAGPSRVGLRARYAERTPLKMLLWIVKKLSTRSTRLAIGVPASVPTA
jgi:hypothetical protein